MRGGPFTIPVIACAAGYAAVAVAIAATALHFRHYRAGESALVHTHLVQNDPLAPELAHCKAIGMAAKDDAACEAAWAENRLRFFTYRPTDGGPSARTTERKPAAKPEGGQ